MTATDEQALLQSILDDPAADAPRLVYADWLDENKKSCGKCDGTGEIDEKNYHGAWDSWKCAACDGTGLVSQSDRAEFIRVQCELSRSDCHHPRGLIKPTPWCRVCVLRHREGELLTDDNRQAWFAVPGLGVQLEGDADKLFWWVQPGGPRIEATIHRGFVERITCTLADWCGGLCPECRDPARAATRRLAGETCRHCGGSGRTPAHGPAVVACQPISRVGLTDRAMVQIPRYGWTFVIADGPSRRNGIPWDVYELMSGEYYKDQPSAADALSDGLIKWAKREADRQKPKENKQ